MGNGKKPDGAKSLHHAGIKDQGKLLTGIVLDLLYPRRCPVCNDIVVPKGRRICPSCSEKLIPVKGARCMKCSKPLSDREKELCYDCASRSHIFEKGIAVFSYNDVVAKSLYQLKYHHRKEYGRFYGSYAAVYAGSLIARWKIQAIVPVPLHYKRMEKRGYNQAEVIAKALGEKLEIPVDIKAVKRVRNTKPQKGLNNRERSHNLREAFLPGKPSGKWERVLIVDDIYTTGSTIDAVSAALKKAGIKQVYFLAIAIGTGL